MEKIKELQQQIDKAVGIIKEHKGINIGGIVAEQIIQILRPKGSKNE
jgi:hypothetical protein